MLVHSQNTKSENQTMLKNTTLYCIISTRWCHILKMSMIIQIVGNLSTKNWENVQKSEVLLSQNALERAVLKSRWYSYQSCHTASWKKKSTWRFVLLPKDDASVFEYPQNVDPREAKINSPEERKYEKQFNYLAEDKQGQINHFQSKGNLLFGVWPFCWRWINISLYPAIQYTCVKDDLS